METLTPLRVWEWKFGPAQWPGLEKEMATHSNILVWEIPSTEEPGGLWSMGLQESDMTEQLNHHHQWPAPSRFPS